MCMWESGLLCCSRRWAARLGSNSEMLHVLLVLMYTNIKSSELQWSSRRSNIRRHKTSGLRSSCRL